MIPSFERLLSILEPIKGLIRATILAPFFIAKLYLYFYWFVSCQPFQNLCSKWAVYTCINTTYVHMWSAVIYNGYKLLGIATGITQKSRLKPYSIRVQSIKRSKMGLTSDLFWLKATTYVNTLCKTIQAFTPTVSFLILDFYLLYLAEICFLVVNQQDKDLDLMTPFCLLPRI